MKGTLICTSAAVFIEGQPLITVKYDASGVSQGRPINELVTLMVPAYPGSYHG